MKRGWEEKTEEEREGEGDTLLIHGREELELLSVGGGVREGREISEGVEGKMTPALRNMESDDRKRRKLDRNLKQAIVGGYQAGLAS